MFSQIDVGKTLFINPPTYRPKWWFQPVECMLCGWNDLMLATRWGYGPWRLTVYVPPRFLRDLCYNKIEYENSGEYVITEVRSASEVIVER